MPKLLFLVSTFFPLLIAGVGLPMALGRVPPNRLYGFRTARSLSSPELWYEYNRLAGWSIVGAGLLSLAAALLIWGVTDVEPGTKLIFSAVALGAITSLAALIPFLLGPAA